MNFKYLLFLFISVIQGCQVSQLDDIERIEVGEVINIYSHTLEEDRDIFIHKPTGLFGMDEQMENLPVVFVLDGESQFLGTVSIIDYLSSATLGNDFFPRSLIIGIPNTNRNRDLTPKKGMIAMDSSSISNTGGGPKFLEFITTELIPYFDKNFSTCNHRTIIGHSLGGLIPFEALLRKRDYFNNYIAIDPAFGFANESYLDEVLDTLRSADLSKENLFFAAANSRPTFLGIKDLFSDTSNLLKLTDIPNGKFMGLQDSMDWQIKMTRRYYDDENHFSVPYRATLDGMRYFYSFYSFPEIINYYHPAYADRDDLVLGITNHYKKISEIMACKIIPMQGYINSFAYGLDVSGRNDLANELFNYNISLYPNSPVVYNNFGYFLERDGNSKQAIKQFDKSLELSYNPEILEVRNRLKTEL